MRKVRTILVGLCLLAISPVAAAYPSAVVFVPTAESKDVGDSWAYAMTTVNLASNESFGSNSQGTPSTSWFGYQIGVAPKIPFGDSGIGFGGAEVGIDFLYPQPIPPAAAKMKPVLNLKLQLLQGAGWIPHVAIGLMEWAAFQPSRSLNMFYATVSEPLTAGTTNLGRVTLGLQYNATDDPLLYNGGVPFKDQKTGLLAGYESPAFGPFSFGIDHVGGYGEVGSTYVGLNVTPIEGAMLTVGGFYQNSRRKAVDVPADVVARNPNYSEEFVVDGVFLMVSMFFNPLKMAGLKKDPPAAPADAPRAAPASASSANAASSNE